MFKKFDQHLIYQDMWLTLYKDDIKFADDTYGTYVWTARKPGVNIVIVNSDHKILLQKEYRYVIDSYSWEVPGGGIDDGETPKQAAIREVKEESGLEIDNLEYLGEFYPLNSFNKEKITAFLGFTKSNSLSTSGLEMSESISEQRFFTFDEVLKMIDNGEITDAMTANITQIVIRKLSSHL